MSRVSVSIVVPVYNERRTISAVLQRIKAVPREKEIIVVDDCSTDGTRRLLREWAADSEVKILEQPVNRGKGAALRRGFAEATKDVVIVQDADFEYDPAEYDKLVAPIERGVADVVYGSRFLHGERRVLYYWHSVANKVLTTMSNALTNLNLTDMETCYKVFKRPIIQNIELESERFGFEPEITIKVAKLGLAMYEVPISYYGRSYREGKKITWRDAVAAFWHVLRFALSGKSFVIDEQALFSASVVPRDEVPVGEVTLEAFESTPRYNEWIVDRVSKYVKNTVLEVGCGIGNISQELLRRGTVSRLVATDISDVALRVVDGKLGDDDRVTCAKWDVEAEPPAVVAPDAFDTIVSMNVVEHIKDDRLAIARMTSRAKVGGRLIILVPANPSLFCGLDSELGHFRRYRRETLLDLFRGNGLAVDECFPHNFLGSVGWWWAGKVRKQRVLPAESTKWFDVLVPLLRWIDPVLVKVAGGVSWIVVATRVH